MGGAGRVSAQVEEFALKVCQVDPLMELHGRLLRFAHEALGVIAGFRDGRGLAQGAVVGTKGAIGEPGALLAEVTERRHDR
ncbi:hypothetical protein Q427_19455 [Halomonas sp. BC04]|nr:hypothetical protein Q427_19455 [Halomonas sp. BC04]